MLDNECAHLYVKSAAEGPKQKFTAMWIWQMIPWLTIFAATFAYQMYKAKTVPSMKKKS